MSSRSQAEPLLALADVEVKRLGRFSANMNGLGGWLGGLETYF